MEILGLRHDSLMGSAEGLLSIVKSPKGSKGYMAMSQNSQSPGILSSKIARKWKFPARWYCSVEHVEPYESRYIQDYDVTCTGCILIFKGASKTCNWRSFGWQVQFLEACKVCRAPVATTASLVRPHWPRSFASMP